MALFTPYRIRLTSSGATAELRGITGTQTDGITLVGAYNAGMQMHEFEVVVSGNYTLWEDPNGGVAFVRRTDWSDVDGKFVAGVDIQDINQRLHGVRYAAQFDDLQEAVDDLVTEGRIEAAGGEQEVDAPVAVGDKMLITGSGAGSTVKMVTGTTDTADVLSWEDVTNVNGAVVRDLTVDGNNTTTTGNQEQKHCISFDRLSPRTKGYNMQVGPGVILKNPGGDGVYFRNTENMLVHDTFIDVNWQRIGSGLCGRNGVAILDGKYAIYKGLVISGGATTGIDLEPALVTEGIEGIIIDSCVIKDCLWGIGLHSGVGGLGKVKFIQVNNCIIYIGDASAFGVGVVGLGLYYAQYVTLSNLTIVGQSDLAKSGVGIYLYGCNHIDISNPVIKNATIGIQVDAAVAATNDLTIRGGRIINCGYQGIAVYHTVGIPGSNLIIDGATIVNNSKLSLGVYYGVQVVYTDNVQITNLKVYDTDTPAYQRGVRLSNCDNVIYIGNQAFDNSTYQHYFASVTNVDYGHNTGTIEIA